MILALVLGCATVEPSAPPGVVHVRVREDGLYVDGVRRAEDALFDPSNPLLEEAAGLWFDLPAGTRWEKVRPLWVSARESLDKSLWIGLDGRAPVGPLTAAPPRLLGCGGGGTEVRGVGYTLIFELQIQDNTRWVDAAARFAPLGPEGRPEPLLAPSCWRDPSCDALPRPARDACAHPPPRAPRRLSLAGEGGCLLPTARGDARWRKTLPHALAPFAIPAGTPALVLVEDAVPVADLLELLAGLMASGLSPELGRLSTVSDEVTPACETDESVAKNDDDIARAAGAWFGATLAARTPEDAP